MELCFVWVNVSMEVEWSETSEAPCLSHSDVNRYVYCICYNISSCNINKQLPYPIDKFNNTQMFNFNVIFTLP